MTLITPCDITLFMAFILFLLGLGTTLAGVIVLLNHARGKDSRALAAQATRLVQKGLAEDVAGLVGNANILLSTLNEMGRTAAGIGIFLTVSGLVTMAAPFLLIFQTRALCLN